MNAHEAIVAEALRLHPLANYDADQMRGADGKWTSDGASGQSAEAERASAAVSGSDDPVDRAHAHDAAAEAHRRAAEGNIAVGREDQASHHLTMQRQHVRAASMLRAHAAAEVSPGFQRYYGSRRSLVSRAPFG